MSRVNLTDLLIFTNQFSSMLQSQLPLIAVLRNLSAETPDRQLRAVVEDVTDDLEHGVDFGDALAAHPEVFDDIFVNVVRAGMLSGRLGDSLAQMTEFLTKADLVRRKVRGAVSYPMFMFLAFIGVFNGLVFFILPRFERMFSSFNKRLPAATEYLLAVGGFWKAHWMGVMLTLVLVVVGFVVWISTAEGRYVWDRVKLGYPVVGRLWRIAALSRFMRTFGVQVHNEVELLKALELAALSCGNAYIEETLLGIADEIEQGRGISDSFREHEVFSGIVLQMISAGEESGNLHSLLLSAADYFERLLDNEISLITGLINPVLTVVIGLAIAGMMVAVFLPVFDMGSAMGR